MVCLTSKPYASIVNSCRKNRDLSSLKFFSKANPSLAEEYGNFVGKGQAISAAGSTNGDDVN